jgi:xylulokinase
MQDAILGLDIGTTSTKAVLYDLAGTELAAAERPYPFQTPQTGWVEQDPEQLWAALVETVRAALAGAEKRVRPVAMALAAQSGSLIPARQDGLPVYPVITWLDGRTEELVKRWKEAGVEAQVRQVSGWLLHPGLCLPAIAWLRQHKPEIFAAAERFLSVNDFLVYRLTGRFCTNPSNGGGMQLADVATATWSRALCDLAGIQPDRLSPIRPAGTVIGSITAEASRLAGLPSETAVVNGGHDQGCTALAMGVTSPGKVLLAGGTSWVVTTVVTEPAVEIIPEGMDMNFHPAPGRWTVSQSLGGLGASLEWWLNQGWQGPDRQSPAERVVLYAALDRELRQSSASRDGLFFLPLAGGHQEPAGVQRGGFVGLRLGHSRGDMARAILEGAAFELRWALERMQQAGLAVERLWLVGGAARSPVWPKIVADVTGLPIYLPQYGQWPALGAAILAGWGTGLYESLEAGQARFQKAAELVEPDRHRYDDSFGRYQRLVELQATIALEA